MFEKDDDDSVLDFSLCSKVSSTLFESQNSLKSILSHLNAEFEHEKLYNTGPQIFSKDVANVVGDISFAAQSSITSEKPVDLEEWKHIMTEDESE